MLSVAGRKVPPSNVMLLKVVLPVSPAAPGLPAPVSLPSVAVAVSDRLAVNGLLLAGMTAVVLRW